MREQFRQYIIRLYQDIPAEIYEGLLSLFFIGAVGIIVYYGWKSGWKTVVGLLLVEYVFFIYCSTVVCRKASESVDGHNFSPFWSYEAIKNGKEDLIEENIMNVVVFVPVGLLLGLVTLKLRNGWRTQIARISLIVGTGLMISGSIEALQYFSKRGFSELDDVFHNTIGCLIGYILVYGSRLMIHGYGNR